MSVRMNPQYATNFRLFTLFNPGYVDVQQWCQGFPLVISLKRFVFAVYWALQYFTWRTTEEQVFASLKVMLLFQISSKWNVGASLL